MIWYKNSTIILLLSLIILNVLFINNNIFYFVLLFFLFKKSIYLFQQKNQFQAVSAEFQSDFIYSPINGVITSIQRNSNEIRLVCQLPIFSSRCVCLPFNGVVSSIETRRKNGKFLERIKNIDIKLKSPSFDLNMIFLMSSFQYFYSILRVGDMGKAGAVFSQMPFYSKLELVFPSKFTLNVIEGDKITLGRTNLASLD
jgi:hypothetical protein